MSVKQYDIKIPKFNYHIISIGILDENKDLVKLGPDDLIFMTVKHSPEDEEYKFQKSLENGITFNEQTHKYDIEIEYEDTKDLLYNTSYGYDITIYYDGNKPKQKVVGKFTISDKYTVNEVV